MSRYRIAAQIGSGAMGDVYKATDTSLERFVALKILRGDLIHDPDRLRRFTQEAKAASALNHPHVIHIYEIGESDGTHFIAMEYVDGVSLRQKIHGEEAPIGTLLPLLVQVAEALAKAHAAGIIHRDLKPDNIMISADGYAKILDFGLAKLVDRLPLPSDLTLDKREATAEGAIVGTVGYMAPEQVEGRPIDHRADIFSFGCIVYEAATRRRPFEGRSAVDTLHKILDEEPAPISESGSYTPADLQRIIRRCLKKNPDERYQSMKDIAIELNELRSDTSVRAPLAGRSRQRTPWFVLVSAVAILAVVAAAVLLRQAPGMATPPEIMKITSSGKVTNVAIAPNGDYVAYVQNDLMRNRSSLWVYHLPTGSKTEVLPGAKYFAYHDVSFSPDSNHILYTAREAVGLSSLFSVPLLGGSPTRLVRDVETGAAVSADGRKIAFLRQPPNKPQLLLIVANGDGTNEEVLFVMKMSEGLETIHPAWSRDGTLLFFALKTFRGQGSRLETIKLSNRQVAWFGPEWGSIQSISRVASSDIMFLVATPKGQQQPAIWRVDRSNVQKVSAGTNAYAAISVAGDGRTAVAVTRQIKANLWVVPLAAPARANEITSGSAANGADGVVALPDGRILYTSDATGGSLRILNGEGLESEVPLHGRGKIGFPSVSADGHSIVADWWHGGQGRVARIDLDTGAVHELTPPGSFVFQPQYSPDGRWILYTVLLPPQSLFRVPSDGGLPQKVFDHAGMGAYSPDGKWIASFAKIGGNAVFAVFPASGGAPVATFRPHSFKYPIRWTRDSKAILYIERQNGEQNIWSQPILGGTPRQITSFNADDQIIWSFDLLPDGKSIVCSRGNIEQDAVVIRNMQ